MTHRPCTTRTGLRGLALIFWLPVFGCGSSQTPPDARTAADPQSTPAVAGEVAPQEHTPPSKGHEPPAGDAGAEASPPGEPSEGSTGQDWSAVRCEVKPDHNDCYQETPDAIQAGGGPRWVQRREVSVRAFEACMRSEACERSQVGPAGPFTTLETPEWGDYPINAITFASAEAVCSFLGGRLPTADEWTAIATAGDDRRWPWGPRPRCPRQVDVAKRAWPKDLPPLEQVCGKMISRLAVQVTTAELDALADRIQGWPANDVISLCKTLEEAPEEGLAERLQKELAAREPSASTGTDVELCAREGVGAPSGVITGHPLGLLALGGNVAEWTTEAAGEGRHMTRGGSWMSSAWEELEVAAREPVPDTDFAVDVGVRCVADEL